MRVFILECVSVMVHISCQGVCKNLEVDLGQSQIQIEGYLFELGGINLILGVNWLLTGMSC